MIVRHLSGVRARSVRDWICTLQNPDKRHEPAACQSHPWAESVYGLPVHRNPSHEEEERRLKRKSFDIDGHVHELTFTSDRRQRLLDDP